MHVKALHPGRRVGVKGDDQPGPELQRKAVWLSGHGIVENVGSVGEYDRLANELLVSLIAPPDPVLRDWVPALRDAMGDGKHRQGRALDADVKDKHAVARRPPAATIRVWRGGRRSIL